VAEAFVATPRTVAVERQRAYLRDVFAWMFLGLALTTGVAIYLQESADVVGFFQDNDWAIWASIGAQLALVITLELTLSRITAPIAALMFCLYAGLIGVTFALVFEVYTTASVVGAFSGATGLFAGMAVYGYTTKRDLSSWGGVLFGALIGLIAASIAHLLVGGETLNLLIGFGGVIVFSGLTAYDMQKLKEIGGIEYESEDEQQRVAIHGALALYLDFINLVFSLLRIFGRR
jgi:FtsH-binding integral membrane protein